MYLPWVLEKIVFFLQVTSRTARSTVDIQIRNTLQEDLITLENTLTRLKYLKTIFVDLILQNQFHIIDLCSHVCIFVN